MVRSIAVVILGCLYAAGATWLVRGQGHAYRDALQRERLAAAKTEAPVPRPIEAVVEGPPRPEPPPTVAAPPPARLRVEPSAPVPDLAELAEANPKPANPPRPVPVPAKVPDAVPRPTNLDPIWDQTQVKKKWDLANLKIADEVQLGRDFNDLVLTLNRQVQDASLQRRVEEAARPFLANLSRKSINYTFTILDSDAVNVFSAPGGFVYVCSGLFNLIGEDEDNALEFVVGHEMAHVDLEHARMCLLDPGVVEKVPGGTVQKLYMPIIPFAYPDGLEYEADRWAYLRMRQAGRSAHASLAFLRKFGGYAEGQGFPNGREKPKPDGNRSLVDNHFRAHPAAWRRLDQLKAFIAKSADAPK